MTNPKNQYSSERPTEPVPLRIEAAASTLALSPAQRFRVTSLTCREDSSTDHLAQIEKDDGIPLHVGTQRRVDFDRSSTSFLVCCLAPVLSLFGDKLQVSSLESFACRRQCPGSHLVLFVVVHVARPKFDSSEETIDQRSPPFTVGAYQGYLIAELLAPGTTLLSIACRLAHAKWPAELHNRRHGT